MDFGQILLTHFILFCFISGICITVWNDRKVDWISLFYVFIFCLSFRTIPCGSQGFFTPTSNSITLKQIYSEVIIQQIQYFFAHKVHSGSIPGNPSDPLYTLHVLIHSGLLATLPCKCGYNSYFIEEEIGTQGVQWPARGQTSSRGFSQNRNSSSCRVHIAHIYCLPLTWVVFRLVWVFVIRSILQGWR